MNLRSVDLNLLIIFEALSVEGSVTAAAAKVGMSQPALSEALGRLRETFADPLFVRQDGRMAPTRKALALAEPIASALASIRSAFEDGGRFDAATTRRVFRLGLSDYAEAIILPALLGPLAGQAPRVALRTVATTPAKALIDLDRAEIDLAIDVFPVVLDARYARTPLLAEYAECLTRPGFPLDVGSYTSTPHAVRSPTGDVGVGVVEDALRSQGLTRTIAVNVGHVLALAPVLRRTSMIATQPSRIARMIAADGQLEVQAPPIPIPAWSVDMIAGPRALHDSGTMWLARTIADICSNL